MKNPAFRIVMVTILAIASSQAEAQQVTIRGRVTDAANGLPVPRASVRISNTTTGAISDSSGVYTFVWRRSSTRDTTVEIEANHVRFTQQKRSVRISASSVTVDFTLNAVPVAVTTAPSRGAVGGRGAGAGGAVAAGSAVGAGAGRGAGGGGGGGGRGGAAGRGIQQGQAAQQRPAPLPCLNPAACPNTEAYDRIVDNPFLAVSTNALSTFSIDVDRASYSNVRRFITQGQRPPKDAVRIEEMLNYFSYDYPDPRGDHPFSVTTEVAPAPWNRQHHLVRIGLQGRKIETAKLPPNNLVFLVDVSGSMNTPNKLPLVKQSLRMLVEQLREQDRVAMVVYAGAAGLVLEPTSGANKAEIFAAIDRLEAGGSTAGGAGLRLAYAVAKHFYVSSGNNRVILASDGDFNVGTSSQADLERLVEEERKSGTFLTVLGYGMGNLQDARLQTIADKGNGNYAYIDDIAEARKTLVQEMGGTLNTIAKDVKLQVEFNPGLVQAYRLIGYENRMLRAEDFNNDQKDAGEMGAGHSVTALYEVIPVGVRSNVPIRGVDSLRYQTPPGRTAAAAGSELMFVKLRYKQPAGDTSILLSHPVQNRLSQPTDDFIFATAIAEFGMILRDSEYKQNSTLEDVVALLRRSTGEDLFGYRGDFLRLVQAYERMR